MTKRRGASLINVMVFMMFAVMVTAQVFFFTKSSSDSLAEGREIMRYRLHLQSLVEEAKDRLKIKSGTDTISHDNSLHSVSGTTSTYSALTYDKFFTDTKLLSQDLSGYHVSIHDLDYSFDVSGFNRSKWTDKDTGYGNTNAHKKLFAAMPPLSIDHEETTTTTTDPSTGTTTTTTTPRYYEITNRFYLIRAWTKLPENYYGARLMYQVLVSRDENIDNITTTYHNIETLSFQEVWY